MSNENKCYYWLKLQENFFEDDTIDFLESLPNGERYVLFYLKLCLKALKDEGKLIRYVGNTLIPYDDKSLSKLTKTDIDIVHSAMAIFRQYGLISVLETGEIYLALLKEMVGKETESARKMRKLRLKEKGHNVTKMLPECDANVTQSLESESESESESELELDKDKELEETANKFAIPEPLEVFQFYHQKELNVKPDRFFNFNQKKGWGLKDWKKAYIGMSERYSPGEAYDPDLEFEQDDYNIS